MTRKVTVTEPTAEEIKSARQAMIRDGACPTCRQDAYWDEALGSHLSAPHHRWCPIRHT